MVAAKEKFRVVGWVDATAEMMVDEMAVALASLTVVGSVELMVVWWALRSVV